MNHANSQPLLRTWGRKLLRGLFHYDPDFKDWYRDPEFKAAGAYYLAKIAPLLNGQAKDQLRIVDLGSHSGRITIPLIQAGYVNTTGIDTSGMAVHRGNQTLASMGLGPHFKKAETFRYLRRCPAESLNVILAVGLLCLCPHYRAILKEIARCARRGGHLVATFKTKFILFDECLKYHLYDGAHYVVHHVETQKNLHGLGCNWQTSEEVRSLLTEDGWQIVSCERNPAAGRAITYPARLQHYLELYPQDADKLEFLSENCMEFVVIATQGIVEEHARR